MRRVARLVGRLVELVVVLLCLAIVGVVVLAAITTQRGWIQATGTITIQGLHRPVTVVRDRYGIIQITADDRHDLFLAQGYVHAQERMWQMEVSRRIGAGRLSELFGKSQVDRDRYIRTLGWRVAAERDVAAMSADSKAILQAYSDGVNAWITEHDGQLSTAFVVAGLLSGSGGLGGIPLEPWTPLDTTTWQKVQAWSLGGNADTEIFRLLADARLGDPARTDALFPAYDPGAPVITPSGLVGSGGAGAPATPATPSSTDQSAAPAPTALNAAHLTALADIARLGTEISGIAGLGGGDGMVGSHGVGSNDWVVSGERTLSGKPILANDPHLGFGMPSVWIMNGLHCRTIDDGCRWDVVGVTFPGAPAVVLGHNARIAWGATNVGPDTQDLFVEKPDPADPDGHYLYQGASIAYDVRHETIKVGGGADVEIDIRSTRHGVVLSDVDERLDDGPVLSLRWTTTAEVDVALETFFEIDNATSFDDFKAAFDGYGSPSQNFVYADVDGHIGYVLPGLIPIRAGERTGDRVRDGSSGSQEWTGYVPRADLPWQLDPAGGQIVSANNAPVDAQYPSWLGSDWDPGYRAARITERLADVPGKLTAEDMRSIQLDAHVLRADKIMHRLELLGPLAITDDGRLLWSRMVDWNRECDVGSLGCAAYMSVEVALQRAIFDDELGPLARDYVGSTFSWEALAAVVGRPSDPWWSDTSPGAPAGVADAPGVAGAAIDRTAAELRTAYGDPANWTWGRLHKVTFREGTLGESGIPPLEWYFNAPGRPVAGADGAIDNNYYQVSRAYPDPDEPGSTGVGIESLFDVSNGPSYRFTIDMDDLDGAQIVITTGQSGNPFDAHYGDLIAKWANGETIPLPFSPTNIAAGAAQTLTLSPP
jgi:penicillin amidase